MKIPNKLYLANWHTIVAVYHLKNTDNNGYLTSIVRWFDLFDFV